MSSAGPKGSQSGSNRENQEWLNDLRGTTGAEAQRAAHEDLANYLYVVVYNYLLRRQGTVAALEHFAINELTELAQDLVQETLEKLGQNQFERLNQFTGAGRFTAWAAQIITNHASSELRRPYWSRRQVLAEDTYVAQEDQKSVLPEAAVLQGQAGEILYSCIEKLQQRYQVAFLRCIAEGERAEDVAADLEITANAVYLLVYRSKRTVRKCVEKSGLGPDVLSVF